jgi:hypothetical protein
VDVATVKHVVGRLAGPVDRDDASARGEHVSDPAGKVDEDGFGEVVADLAEDHEIDRPVGQIMRELATGQVDSRAIGAPPTGLGDGVLGDVDCDHAPTPVCELTGQHADRTTWLERRAVAPSGDVSEQVLVASLLVGVVGEPPRIGIRSVELLEERAARRLPIER